MGHSAFSKKGSGLHLNYGSYAMSDAVSLIARLVESHSNKKQIESVFGGRENYLGMLGVCARMDAGKDLRSYMLPDLNVKTIEDADERWYAGDRISMPALALEFMKEFKIRPRSNHGLLVLITALRAEMVKGEVPLDATLQANEPNYHCRVHTFEAAQVVGYLMRHERRLTSMPSRAAQTLALPFVHDIDWPGIGNQGIKHKNEDASVQVIEPLFSALYSDKAEARWMKNRIHTPVRLTDACGPHKDLHKIIKHRDTGMRDWSQCGELRDKFIGEAAVYANFKPNSSAWVMAAVMKAGDLGFSLSGIRMATRLADRLTIEGHKVGSTANLATPAGLSYFVNEIYGHDFMCDSARKFIAPNVPNLTPPQHT